MNVDDVLECSVLRLASAPHAHIKFNDILLIMNEMRSHCRTLDTVKTLSCHLKGKKKTYCIIINNDNTV